MRNRLTTTTTASRLGAHIILHASRKTGAQMGHIANTKLRAAPASCSAKTQTTHALPQTSHASAHSAADTYHNVPGTPPPAPCAQANASMHTITQHTACTPAATQAALCSSTHAPARECSRRQWRTTAHQQAALSALHHHQLPHAHQHHTSATRAACSCR